MAINITVLICLALAALWAVMTRSLLRAAIGLALTSAILTILMFRLDSPVAGVFELSVCSGLISVIFISTISLTHPMTKTQIVQHMKDRLSRFWYLPVVVVIAGIALSLAHVKINIKIPAPEEVKDARYALWYLRHADLIGQIMMLLAGVFGVVLLFKETKKK